MLIAPLGGASGYLKIIVGYVCVVFGQSMFLVGLETSILPIGRMVGGSFAKYNKLIFVLSFGFVFGLLATVAEPALSVLAKQIEAIMPLINSTLFIWITGTGIGIGVASLLSILKILTEINILWFLVPLYAISLIMMIFTPKLFVGLAFDSGGVTGGALTSAFLTPLTLSIAGAVASANIFSLAKIVHDG